MQLRLAAVALALALTGAACGGGSGSHGASGGPDAAASRSPAPPAALAIADVFRLDGSPDWLLDAFGAVWVHADDGHLLQLDPESGALMNSYETGWHELPACQGLGRDADALWTCRDATHLSRIDPEDGSVAPVPLAKRSDEGRLGWSSGLEWVIESGTTDLVGLDEKGRVVARVDLGTVCTDLTADDSAVFVVCPSTGQVIRVDSAARRVSATAAVTDARTAAVADDLFVGSSSALVQLDPDTLAVEHTYAGVPAGEAIAASPSEVWVRSSIGNFLTEVDPRQHVVRAVVEAPQYSGVGDVLLTEHWVWASSSDDGVVVRVRRTG